jgi:mevalonate kinase
MVEGLARLRERRPAFVDRTLGLIQSVVEDARRCIATGDISSLGQLMDLNHMFLAGLMLSTPEIEDAVRIARDAGALGAKLTGSGGGGCVLALTQDSPSRVLEAWQARKLRCFATTLSATSVREGH